MSSVKRISSTKKALSVVMLIIPLVFGLIILSRISQQGEQVETKAATVGQPYIRPSTITFNAGEQISARVLVDGGVNPVVVAMVIFDYDPDKISISNCTAGSAFQGVFNEPPCIVDTDSARIEVQVEAINDVGPAGVVNLAPFTVTGLVTGQTSLRLVGYEVVVEDSAGEPIEYSGGAIGENAPTPRPTRPPSPTTNITPTPTSLAFTLTPSIVPTEEVRPISYSYIPSSAITMVVIIGALLLFMTLFH